MRRFDCILKTASQLKSSLTPLSHKTPPLLQSPWWQLCPSPLQSRVFPADRLKKFLQTFKTTALLPPGVLCCRPDLSAVDLLADEEVHLLFVLRGVVCATRGGQTVSTCSTRLLVVTGQRLSKVPVCNESAKIISMHNQKLKRCSGTYENLRSAALPDISLIYSHAKADGSNNNQHLPLHPLSLHLCAVSCLQTCSHRSRTRKPKSTRIFKSPTSTHLNNLTCMIRLGQDSKLGQLVSHCFTAFSGSTVHNPTALFTNTT